MSSAMDKLLGAVKKAKQGSFEREEDFFYYPQRDVAGNGSAVIRFLPSDKDEIPFVTTYNHGFKNATTNKWFVDNCLSTIEQECPICAENSKLYASMSKEDARKFGMNRKKSFISRILVVEDKKQPDMEGKVFMFKYGQKIFDKIVDKLQPEFEDDVACNIFDLVSGADFKLKLRKVDGNVNYDKSEFADPSECEVLVFEQFNAENDPYRFLDPKKFKSAEKLQERFDFISGKKGGSLPSQPVDDDIEFDEVKPTPKKESKRVEVPKDDDDDDMLAMIQGLADD
jgi:hypothetical protein